MASLNAASTALPPFDPTDRTTAASRWERWLARLGNYLQAMNITDDGRQKGNMLFLAGERVYDIYETECAEADDFATTKRKLTEYFDPFKDVPRAQSKFREATQKPGETIDQYVTRLKMLAKSCDFHEKDHEIRQQITQHALDKDLRKEIYKNPAWNLEDCLKEARAREAADMQIKEVEERESVNRVYSDKSYGGARKKDLQKTSCQAVSREEKPGAKDLKLKKM